MSETELLEIDIKDINNASERIEEALNDLSEVEGFADEDYNYLQDIVDKLQTLRIEKENKMEILED